MKDWFGKWFAGLQLPQAPPVGVSVSEQSLENEIWRIQLDLATGGVRSLLLRGTGRDLVDPDAAIHPFQGVRRDPANAVLAASRHEKSRARFDTTGASLSVKSSLAGGVWKTAFLLLAGDPALRMHVEWEGIEPGAFLELALPMIVPGASPGGAWRAGGEDWMRREGPAPMAPVTVRRARSRPRIGSRGDPAPS